MSRRSRERALTFLLWVGVAALVVMLAASVGVVAVVVELLG